MLRPCHQDTVDNRADTTAVYCLIMHRAGMVPGRHDQPNPLAVAGLPSPHQPCGVAWSGIALASNLGGMTSPISSPQNIFAIQEMGRDGQARGFRV